LVDDIQMKNRWSRIKVTVVSQLRVDYSLTIKSLITAGGYDNVNIYITKKNFPANAKESGKKELVFRIFRFKNLTSSQRVIQSMKQRGCRPATLRELVVFGKANPDLQRKYPIIALGSVWLTPCGNRFVPELRSHAAWRYLELDYYDNDWDYSIRFLAIIGA